MMYSGQVLIEVRAMGTTNRKPRRVTASQLAELVVCERKSVFRARYGWRPNAWRSAKLSAGLRAHDRFWREGRNQRSSSALHWILALALVVALLLAVICQGGWS
jgi:hypothetical protein